MISETTIRHINGMDEFESLREAWEKLSSRREVRTVFLTWEWLFSWWKTHQAGRELWLITAWQKDELVGIAPLMLSREKKYLLGFRLLQSLGAPNTDESDFLALNDDPVILGALCRYILQNRNKWDAIILHEHRSSRATTRAIREAFSKDKLVVRTRVNHHYYIPISDHSWDGYLKSLSKNLRQNLDRRLRRIRETNTLTFEHHKGRDIRWEHFESIFDVSKRGAFPEKYESETERAFHRELLERMAPRGWMEIIFVSLD